MSRQVPGLSTVFSDGSAARLLGYVRFQIELLLASDPPTMHSVDGSERLLLDFGIFGRQRSPPTSSESVQARVLGRPEQRNYFFALRLSANGFIVVADLFLALSASNACVLHRRLDSPSVSIRSLSA